MHLTLDEFAKQMAATNKVMAQKMADDLLRENSLVNYLNAHGRKPIKWSWQSELHKWRSRVGQIFLHIANALGEYNDSEY